MIHEEGESLGTLRGIEGVDKYSVVSIIHQHDSRIMMVGGCRERAGAIDTGTPFKDGTKEA